MSKIFSLADVAAENKKKDKCYIVVKGEVFEVEKYLNDHPGGADIIRSQSGKDATNAYEDIGHSQNAQSTLATYKVGKLNAEDAAKCEAENKEKKKGGAGVGIFAVIAIAVAAAAVYYFQVVKQPTQ